MLNLALGTASNDAGRSVLTTTTGRTGHAIHGPYEYRDPGSYSVGFHVALAGPVSGRRNPVCAVLDVVRNNGAETLVSRTIKLADLRGGRTGFLLNFTLADRSKLEYRIWTSGAVALELEEHRRVSRLDQPSGGTTAVAQCAEFPAAAEGLPAFFTAHHARFRDYYERGFAVGFVNDDPVLTVDGVSFYARSDDDFMFIGEVFAANVYNFVLDQPTCVIDIGMNIGYSSLQFARNAHVSEVHAFEPFADTYRRAVDNLSLNPALADRIRHHCLGLSDRDWSGDVMAGSDNSGSQTVVADVGTRPVAVTLADAGGTLRPILENARAQGLRVVVKVDCEGSEFAIFRSLEQAGLFTGIDAIMVEWHAMFDATNQFDLIRPLREAGFIIFDQSPAVGNGFFYGARLAAI